MSDNGAKQNSVMGQMDAVRWIGTILILGLFVLFLFGMMLGCSAGPGSTSDSKSGVDGDNGLQGEQGPVGPQGPTGKAGPAGPSGLPGATPTATTATEPCSYTHAYNGQEYLYAVHEYSGKTAQQLGTVTAQAHYLVGMNPTMPDEFSYMNTTVIVTSGKAAVSCGPKSLQWADEVVFYSWE